MVTKKVSKSKKILKTDAKPEVKAKATKKVSLKKKENTASAKKSAKRQPETKKLAKPVKTKQKKSSLIWLFFVAIVVAAAIIMAVISFMNVKRIVLKKVDSMYDINDELHINIKEPIDANEIIYGIENDAVARMDYAKDFGENGSMNFVLRSSAAPDEDIVGLNNKWGTKIIMTVMCDDESDIEVEAYVAVDDVKVMKGTWYDNDLYYSMTTDNLTTREDFLKEINRVIIDNHIEF